MLVAFLAAAAVAQRSAEPVERPNVLVMMVDDLGWSDLGCYGSEIQTPELDRLAAGGVRLTQFYNTAKCAESRATLLSGRYHGEVQTEKLSGCRTIAEVLRDAGYATAMTGKWHLDGSPIDRGFERYWGHLSGATDCFVGDDTFRFGREPWDDFDDGFYTTDANVDYAIEFLDQMRATGKPWLQYIAFNAPHYPLQAPRADIEKYLPQYEVGYHEIAGARLAKQKRLGLVHNHLPLPPWPDNAKRWSDLYESERFHETLRMATFAAMVDRIDQAIGRLLADLSAHEEFENTLVIFVSDNGGCPFDRNHNLDRQPWEGRSHWTYDTRWAHVSNTPWREYKRNQHEGGISSPCIIHWPQQTTRRAGSLSYEVGHLVDILPTVVDATGASRPTPASELRGRSLLPLLTSQKLANRGRLIFDWQGVHSGLREGDWKLVAIDRGPWELYDLSKDRQEQHDLSRSHPERLNRMIAQWQTLADEIGYVRKRPKEKRKQPEGARESPKGRGRTGGR